MERFFFAAAAILACADPRSALADDKTSQPSWDVSAVYRDDNGAFDRCAMRTRFQGGVSVTIALRTDGTVELSFFRSEGFGSAPLRLSLYADDKPIFTGLGTLDAEGTTLSLAEPIGEAGMSTLKAAATLRVASAFGFSIFSLSGADPAFAELAECVDFRRQSAFGPAKAKDQSRLPEDATAAKGDLDGPHAVPKDQLLSYVTEILQIAGVSNYRFLDAADLAKPGLTWQFEDGSIGSLIAVEKAAAFDLDRFVAEIAASDTADCHGDFAGGKKAPRFVNGVEIRKVFSSCSAGPRSFYAEYALVKLPAGLLLKLTAANPGEPALPAKSSSNPQSGRDRAARTEEATLAAFSRRQIQLAAP